MTVTVTVSGSPKCPGPGWRKLEIGEIIGEKDLVWYGGQWQPPLITGHALSASDLLTWRVIDPVEGPQWRDVAADEVLESADLYWSRSRSCWAPNLYVGVPAGNTGADFCYRRWVGDQVKTADVITQPGLYEDRMGRVCEVTVEESQSEGKQWVVRADGSPTYYTSDGRRVSYKGPGSENDDPCQLMRYVGPPGSAITAVESDPEPVLEPITVKAGWWEMRDGHQIQVFEWQPDPPQPKNPFKWCGLTPSGDVIFWTDGGHCVFSVIAATQEISDNDLVKFLGVPDSVRIRTLNETLEMKQEAIQDLGHDLAQRQKTIEAQASSIQSLQTDIEQKVLHISTARLSDLQQRYNDMVVDRDEWREKAIEQERLVSFKIDTIKILQAQLSQMSQKQPPADSQAAIDGIAALRAEIDRLSEKKESITRLALTKQEENDKLRQLNTELQIRLDAMTNAFESQAETSRQLQADGEEWSKTAIELQDKAVKLQGKLDAQAVIIAKRLADLSGLREQISQVNSHPNLSLIVAKLTKPDNQQQQQIIIEGLLVVSQLVRKNLDYKSSAFTAPILLPQVSPFVAMCCRASDKIARLANLLSGHQAQVENESILDTIADLAGYSILLLTYGRTTQGQVDIDQIRGHRSPEPGGEEKEAE